MWLEFLLKLSQATTHGVVGGLYYFFDLPHLTFVVNSHLTVTLGFSTRFSSGFTSEFVLNLSGFCWRTTKNLISSNWVFHCFLSRKNKGKNPLCFNKSRKKLKFFAYIGRIYRCNYRFANHMVLHCFLS